MNLYPDRPDPVYCLIPDAQFFEFIKVEDMNKGEIRLVQGAISKLIKQAIWNEYKQVIR